ncbi:MAG: thiol protease/hemagglutinin PrtT [Bacteroidales bacterium]|nr:thiol protease/hemagglutinin PrtT [Bacteroidales bacterium]
MKKYFTLLLGLLFSLAIWANPIDTTLAHQVALNFWRQNLMQNGSTHEPNVPLLQLVPTTYQNIFIFNNASENGWLIVSGDNCAHPILGFSLEGNWKSNEMPSTIKSWIQGYDDEIQSVSAQNLIPDEQIAREWNTLANGIWEKPQKNVQAIEPLLSTTWGQEDGYNDYCPYNYLIFTRTPTGCVATAMAQVMKYWEWPVTGTGSHTYHCDFYGSQTANFGNSIYEWTAMPYNKGSESVALLMYHCGVSIDMDYGYEGSAASTSEVPKSMKDYFRYSSDMYYAKKSQYTNSSWEKLLIDNLESYCPIIYRGTSSSGGHAFVCDGYKKVSSSNYFHFNFGWNGSGNTYCLLSSVTPSGSSSNFSTDQAGIFSCYPDLNYWGGYSMGMYDQLESSASNVQCYENFWVKAAIANYGSNNYSSGKWAIAAFDYDTGNFVEWLQFHANASLQSNYYTTQTFSPIHLTHTGQFYLIIYYYNAEADAYYPIMPTPDYGNGIVITCTGNCPHVGIDNDEANEGIDIHSCHIFPNPTSDFIQVVLNPGYQYTALQVINEQGQIVKTQKIVSTNTKIDLEGFSSGTYSIRLLSPGESITRKVIINK